MAREMAAASSMRAEFRSHWFLPVAESSTPGDGRGRGALHAAVTGSSGTRLIRDGVNQNVFSDRFADRLAGNSGQDLFLADIALDEAGAVRDTITDLNNNETSLDIDSL